MKQFKLSKDIFNKIAEFSDKYNPSGVLNKIEEWDISVLGATSTILFHMKKLVISDESINNKVAQKIKIYFPKTKIYSVYGLIEALVLGLVIWNQKNLGKQTMPLMCH